jgi:hypothetical protein
MFAGPGVGRLERNSTGDQHVATHNGSVPGWSAVMTTGEVSRLGHDAQTARPGIGSRGRVVIGSAWLAGGALWLAAGLVHADDGWRYDTAAGLWIAADLLILAGLIGLRRLRPHGDSTVGAVALLAAIVARLAFAGAEVTSIVQGNDDNLLLPIGAMLTAASLVTYGVVVARQRRWTGPSRYTAFAMGAYPVVAMIPVAAATGEPPTLMVAIWGVPAALVGLACLKQDS